MTRDPLTYMTHLKLLTHLTYDPLTHCHLWLVESLMWQRSIRSSNRIVSALILVIKT